jgi:hypothetical protein
MDRDRPTTACPGCGLELPVSDGPTHPYIGASPACWALYGELLARDYSAGEYPPHHRLAVDTYAVQHPGRPGRRAIQSVGAHLMRLCLVLERGVFSDRVDSAMRAIMANPPEYRWLDPPEPNGTITVRDVLQAPDVPALAAEVETWARDLWSAWSPHHPTIRAWLDHSVPDLGAS